MYVYSREICFVKQRLLVSTLAASRVIILIVNKVFPAKVISFRHPGGSSVKSFRDACLSTVASAAGCYWFLLAASCLFLTLM